MGIKEAFKKEIFLDNLPRWRFGNKKPNGEIDWKRSIGYKIRFIYDNIEGEFEIVDYRKKNRTTMMIKYNDRELEILPGNIQKCQLGKLLEKITDEFKAEIGQVFKDDKRNLIVTDRKFKIGKNNQRLKYYKYRCNNCGYDEGWIYECNLLKGINCACCSNSPKIAIEGINDIPTTDPWMVKFFQNPEDAKLYTKYSDKTINPICPDCKHIKDKDMKISDIYRYKSIACSCGDGFSYPEKFMFYVFEQLEINFEYQYSPEWIGLKRYDFYFELNNNKYIVETDGKLGHGKNINSFTKRSAEETKADDDYKDMMAEKHGIEVIRIDSDKSELEYIKNNILNSKLNNLFDLSKMDWLKCEKFALSNRVKEACEIKKNNPDMTTGDIAQKMNMNYNTIGKYLKQGAKLGWCNYNPKEEKEKSKIKAIENMKKVCNKPVEIFREGDSLGIFESIAELERQSEKLFEVKLNKTNIGSVCLGKRSHHKGFTFKYV